MERFRASVSDNSRHQLAPAAGSPFTCAGNINEAIDDFGALPRRQLSRVGDLTTRDGPNVVRGDGGHGRRPAIEGRELDLERRAIAVDVHDGTDIACLQAFGGHRCEQHHAIMFLDHVDDSLLARVGRDQPRRLAAGINNPHCAHGPAASSSVRHQPPLDNMFLAVHGMG